MIKITLTTIVLLALSIAAKAQTTIPIKPGLLLEKVINGPPPYDNHYDIMFNIDTIHTAVWVNKYKGKWYSNYPYKVVMKGKKYMTYDARKSLATFLRTTYIIFNSN